MQIWNGSGRYCWRYRADTILSTDGQTEKVKPGYPTLNFVEAGGIIITAYDNGKVLMGWRWLLLMHFFTVKLFLYFSLFSSHFAIHFLITPMHFYKISCSIESHNSAGHNPNRELVPLRVSIKLRHHQWLQWKHLWIYPPPTGDAPTTSEWSTISLSTKLRLILEVMRYMKMVI